MGEIVISLKNVSKCFKRYAHPVDRLKEIVLPQKSRADEFWALREVSLEVMRGDSVGIIGQNGSGKSTLLQILAGTLTPTSGDVKVNGRISALLELGSGFNPEFTGRQNVFFNGRILGLSQKALVSKFDQIAAFADIGEFIDQPVKTYSSGMMVRLAFSVAVSTEPDLLIIDEALAVGDVYFQQKCFERLRELQHSGVTLLFVSHDSLAIYRLCNRAVLMEAGKAVLSATPRQVIELYEANLIKKQDTQPDLVEVEMTSQVEAIAEETTHHAPAQASQVAIQSPTVEIERVRFLDQTGCEVQSVISNQTLQLAIELLFHEQFDDPHVGFKIRSRMGEVIYETNTFCMKQTVGRVEVNTLLETRFQFAVPLVEGEYTVTIGVADGGFGVASFRHQLIYKHDTAMLKVLTDMDAAIWAGLVNLNPSVAISRKVYV